MEILVTGPDGLLGSNLVRELLSRNYKVSVLLEPGKDPMTLKDLPIKKHYGNILDPQILDEVFKGKDIVFHCAASTSVFPARNKNVIKVNVEGTKNIIDASLKHSIKRLIHVGTASSFGSGNCHEKLGDEKNPYLNMGIGMDYMDSKYEGQQLVLEAVKNKKLQAIVVNPTFMLGAFDSRPSSGAMVLAIYNKKVPGSSSGGKNYVAVKDVAIAMANAITMGRIGETYILGNVNLRYAEAFATIAKVLAVKGPKRVLPDALLIAYGTINSFLARTLRFEPAVTKEICKISCEIHFYSPEKARKELLLPQTPIEDAIQECFDWFKNNGYLKK